MPFNQRELVGPMRWVKVFSCYIDRWFVFEKRQDHNLIVHFVFKIALHSMTCIVNPLTASQRKRNCNQLLKTQLFNGFWMIINRSINCPTIVCTCMRTELWFCTMLILVQCFEKDIVHLAQRWRKRKMWVLREDSILRLLKTLRWTAPTTELVNESGESKHPVH